MVAISICDPKYAHIPLSNSCSVSYSKKKIYNNNNNEELFVANGREIKFGFIFIFRNVF